MDGKSYKISNKRLTETEAFATATAEELRVLLALMECEGIFESEDALAKLSSTSRARCISALALWEAEGIITQGDAEHEPTIVEEFEERIRLGEFEETSAVEVAKTIRDDELAWLIDDFARLMNQPTLPTEDIKTITQIYRELKLSVEYIATLAAHLASKNRLTAYRLKDEAMKLVRREVDTYDDLDKYIQNKEDEKSSHPEFRRIMGLYGRSLSPTEKECFEKWGEEFCFSTEIVRLAYDIAALNTGKGSITYMDKILTDWYESGCKTVAECQAHSEARKNSGGYAEKLASRRAKTEAPKPRYGDFDVEDAFKRALERSYGEDGE